MIGTQTQNLIIRLEEEIADNDLAIPYIEQSREDVSQTVSDFNGSVNGVQLEIISIINNINDLKEQQVAIGISAGLVGCTSCGVAGTIFVYAANVYYTDYAYNVPDPWADETGILNNSSLGKGYRLDFYPEDVNVAIGTYCGFTTAGLLNPICLEYFEEIEDLQLQIDELYTDIGPLISDLAPILGTRVDFRMELFAFDSTIDILSGENNQYQDAVAALQNPEITPYFLG